MRSVEPAPVVMVPVSDTVPLIKSRPGLTTFAYIVPPTTFSDPLDGLVHVQITLRERDRAAVRAHRAPSADGQTLGIAQRNGALIVDLRGDRAGSARAL